jgi:toxin ParE1/3/4
MTYEIFKRPQAERDIEECFVYIAEDNLDAGVTFLVAVEDAIEQLAQFPLIGKQQQFTDKRFQNVRMWKIKNFENYLIFYTVQEDRIEVIRILHSARDIEDLFG